MFELLAKSFNYENGMCYVDGVLQSTNEQCTHALKLFAGIGAAILIPLMLISLFLFVFWIVMLVHVIKHEDLKDRNIWLIALLLSLIFSFWGIVAIVYYFAAKRPYDKVSSSKPSN